MTLLSILKCRQLLSENRIKMFQHKIHFISICLFVALIIVAGCAPGERQTEHADASAEVPAAKPINYEESTASMAYRISNAYENIDPNRATFLVDDKRIEIFRQQMQSTDIETRIVGWSHYAYELLNAGRTEQSIAELEALLKEYEKYNVSGDTRLQFHRLLAIAYLRLGEEANCINSRNHASCILPISKEGQYRMTSGSESAMQECLEILEDFPEDGETIYLLNLAAMTIGRYPSGVPAKYRLPEESIHAGAKFPQFTDVSHRVGINGTGLSGGACVEDFDGDGWLDIIRSSWGKDDPLVFWRNSGDGKFVNASEAMGLKGITGGLNIMHSDINNDGLADLFVPRGAWMRDQGRIPNSLLLNLGDGKFADITQEARVLTYAATQTAVFADFNLDGWVDFFVGNESAPHHPYPNEFYLNQKNLTFTNVIDQIGVQIEGFIKGCAVGDVNNDGWPDIYISLLPGENYLLLHKGLNADGIPQFQNIAYTAGIQEPQMSFPTWIWDFDNDGWEDIFVSPYGEGKLFAARDFVRNARGEELNAHPRVYRNNGDLTFTDVSEAMGLRENVYTMGCNYGDLDADGYLDFYLGTGTPEYSSVVPNKMYRNNAGRSFDDVTASGGFGHIQKGHGVAFGDLDRDGDEDIFECLGGAFDGDVYEDILFENPIGQDQSWIVLQFKGVQSNRMAVGARVKIVVATPDGQRTFYRTVSTGGSFGSSSLQLEVGLGDATAIHVIEVTWPVQQRTKQTFQNVKLNTYALITEGKDAIDYPEVSAVEF